MSLRPLDLADRRVVWVAWLAAALLVGSAVVLGAINEVRHRQQVQREAIAQAEILAASVSGALAFEDRDAMREYVDALRASRDVAAAAVYDARGRAIVTYARREDLQPPALAWPPGERRAGGQVSVSRAVAERGTPLGAVHVATMPEPMGALFARHGALALLTIMSFMLLGLLSRFGVQLQRRADELAEANARLTIEMAERARAEDALRQSQKMEALGQLTGGIAHDFNNLLQVVQGAFDLIARRCDKPEKVRDYAMHGLQATERAGSLTRQLLAFSRAQKLELKPFVVSGLIHGMREMLVRTLGADVQLRFDLEPTPVAVLSDRTQLEMAVLNLAINARQAMRQGGEVTISTRQRTVGPGHPVLDPDTYVELAVSDTGPGMDPEIAARAFEPFFSTKAVGEGTGLGLSQVYGVARQAGGEAYIERGPGGGARVVLLLRRSTGEAAMNSVSMDAARAAPAESATILVVDDDADVRQLVCDSLDLLGYRVEAAGGGAEALETLERLTPDLLLLDFAMPGMNGADLATLARRRLPGIPIIFASGYADTAALERAMGGSATILRKPFEINDLAVIVRGALVAHSARQTEH